MNPVSSKVKFIRASRKRVVHRARWILINPGQVIENGCVEVENGFIKGVYRAPTSQGVQKSDTIDHGPGVIMPPLVNAHLHLELSALKNGLCFDNGFESWVSQLLEKRQAAGEKVLTHEAKKAAANLADHGIGYIGEISTLGLTKKIVQSQNLSGVWFHEFIGSLKPESKIQKGEALSFSMAGHAPHSTDPLLLQSVKKQTRLKNLPFSIHLAESDLESEFISGKKGQWTKFLGSRGINTASWPIGSKSPVQYLDDLGGLDPLTLAVHLLNIDNRDLDILVRTGTRVCLCPRSNFNLHKKLPDIGKMLEKKIEPALGSDSLASCGSLSLFDEMSFMRVKYPEIDPAHILAMATINGARALGIEHFAGTLDKGKNSALIYIDSTPGSKSDLIESLTTNET